ncbi:hypothetical protein MVEG_02056 [Podila verticillata NRRL 6337]|nr:hypothetical protein MVEG_02056 [Podila verticillata NRRL 6337]
MTTEGRAFAAMVDVDMSSSTFSSSSSLPSPHSLKRHPTPSLSLPSSSPSSRASSSPPSPISTPVQTSTSTFQHLCSYIPFSFKSGSYIPPPSSKPSSRQDQQPHFSRPPLSGSSSPSSSSPSSSSTSPTSSTFNLRPKNYYSRRHKQMNNTTSPTTNTSARAHHVQASTLYDTRYSSHSDSSDIGKDDCSMSSGYQPLHASAKHAPAPSASSFPSTAAKIVPSVTSRSRALSNASSASFSSSSSSSFSVAQHPTPVLGLVSDGPYLCVLDMAISLYFPIRASVLFVLGFVFSLIIDHLQTQHQLIEYSKATLASPLWDTAGWLPPTCGASAVLIGTIYPLGDYLWWGQRVDRINRDWSSVMRCMGGFIGVNYAASKLPWTSSMQVSCTLALISVGLWFLFDRTLHGFMISLTVASFGTTVAYFLVLHGWYSFTRADFFGVGSWIPCILYSSSVCFGSIGRQLDVVPETWYRNNSMTKAKHFKEE